MNLMQITSLTPTIGARIDVLDPSRTLNDAVLSAVHKALLDHKVLVIPGAVLTPERHLELAREFGEPEIHAFFPNLGPGYDPPTVATSWAYRRTRATRCSRSSTGIARRRKSSFGTDGRHMTS
jgi:alpha-ketoglutarate-dependent taurine dioxygenase